MRAREGVVRFAELFAVRTPAPTLKIRDSLNAVAQTDPLGLLIGGFLRWHTGCRVSLVPPDLGPATGLHLREEVREPPHLQQAEQMRPQSKSYEHVD